MKKPHCQGNLIIRAGHDAVTPFTWAYCSDRGQCLEGVLSADNPLPTGSPTDRTVLLIPASRVLSYRVLPEHQIKKPSAESLLWQIEDELFTDVESLHAVILSRDEEGYYHVAAVDRQLIRSWLEELYQLTITVDAIHPDVMAMPCGTAVKLGEEWLVRYGASAGFCARHDNLSILCQAMNIEVPIQCFSSPFPDIEGWQAGPDHSAMFLLAAGVPDTPGLLSGEFLPQVVVHTTAGFKSLVITSLFSFLMLIILPLSQGLYQQYQTRQLTLNAHNLIRNYFPDIPDNVAPQVWLKKELSQPNRMSGTRGLYAMLQENYDFLKSISSGHIQALFWDAEQQKLVLSITDTSDDLIEMAANYSGTDMIISTKPDPQENVINVSVTRATR